MTLNVLAIACVSYVALLFVVAFLAERNAATRWLNGPVIYTLSLSIYCTAWTFYGAVGSAARSGPEFMTIYLGPTLIMVGWWWVLRKLVAIGRAERITSIADLISSRFGKSSGLAALVTFIAVIGTTPYIALQLQSVTSSVRAFAAPNQQAPDASMLGLLVAGGLAIFTIIFGTRRLDAGERHHGIVSAVAVEAVVKLVALLAVGVFVVWTLNGGIGPTLDAIAASPVAQREVAPARWVGMIAVAAAAIICLPRMFHVLVVENTDTRHLAAASWAFPLYLLAMCLFVVPIAVTGLERLPDGNPDLFVLTLPLSEGQGNLAMLAFLGGFSSATSMVIVASVALATMLSNHVVMPFWLARRSDQRATISGDVREAVLRARRVSILLVMGMGWGYFRATGGSEALASIGLIAFVGMAQMLPAVIAGLFWEGATRRGAAVGITSGFILWAWTMLLPVFDAGWVDYLLREGPFGFAALRPEAMFGIEGDPFLMTVVLSLGVNAALLCVVSLFTQATPLEQLQASRFTRALERPVQPRARQASASSAELLLMAQRILGYDQARALFAKQAQRQGRPDHPPEPTPELLETLERSLAGSVGAVTAHAMVSSMTGDTGVSVQDLIAVADETARIMDYSTRLEAQSAELTRTARELRAANDKLTRLSVQKDAFLSQVSHELRTPMTSIRAFSEILLSDEMGGKDRERYAGIILDESQRLTRLLDDLLDLGVLESGQVELARDDVALSAVLDRAVTAATSMAGTRLTIVRDKTKEAGVVHTDADRLAQVFINLIANAGKYCDAPEPRLEITVLQQNGQAVIDFVDNGSGIAEADQSLIFEKFARLTDQAKAGSAGLGLAICREIMNRLDGTISYLSGKSGAAFRVELPLAKASVRAAE